MKYKRSEIKLRAEAIARCYCAARYMRAYPGCTPVAAWSHSNWHWRPFVESALDILVLAEAADEVAARAVE